jgi:hypothetical protein
MTYTSMICFLLFINRCPSRISSSLCSWWHTHLSYVFCYLLTDALAGLVVACVLDDIHMYDMFFCYLLTDALAGLVVACVLDDIHIYDMFLLFINRCPSWISGSVCSWRHTHLWYVFCYLLTDALAGLVVVCVLNVIHIYDMCFVIY